MKRISTVLLVTLAAINGYSGSSEDLTQDVSITNVVSLLREWAEKKRLLDLVLYRDSDTSSRFDEGDIQRFVRDSSLQLRIRLLAPFIVDLDALATAVAASKPSDELGYPPLRWGIVIKESPGLSNQMHQSISIFANTFLTSGVINGKRVDFDAEKMKKWMHDNFSWRFPEFELNGKGQKNKHEGKGRRNKEAANGEEKRVGVSGSDRMKGSSDQP